MRHEREHRRRAIVALNVISVRACKKRRLPEARAVTGQPEHENE